MMSNNQRYDILTTEECDVEYDYINGQPISDAIVDLYMAIRKLEPLDRFYILMRLEGFTQAEMADRLISSKVLEDLPILDSVELDDDERYEIKISDLPSMSQQAIQKKEKDIIKKLRRLLNASTNT